MLLKIRPAKINFYIRFMRNNGFTSDQMLAGTDLTSKDMENPNFLIDITKYIRIVFNLKQLYQTPTLAFELGKFLSMGDIGVLGYAMMSSANTFEAYSVYRQYSSLFFGNLIDVNLIDDHHYRLAVYTPNIDTEISRDLLQFLIEERINIDVKAFQRYGWDHHTFPVKEWHVTYPEPTPEIVKLYKGLINVPIRFSSKHNMFVLRKDAMSITYLTGDAETHELCLKRLDEIYSNFHCHDQFTTQVRQILFNHLSDIPNIDEVAKELFCSKRTLNRKLNQEGTTFAQLVANTRLDAIINYAVTTDISQEEISHKLDFSDARSLRRFFKSKTNKTISNYKKEVKENMYKADKKRQGT